MTHPFHPLCGQRFEVVTVRHNWHEDRVCYRDGKQLASLPLRWTSLAPADPFAVVSKGRAWFRPEDLMRLAELIERVRSVKLAVGGSGDA